MKTQFLKNVLLCTAIGLVALSCSKHKPEAEPGHGWGEAVFSVETVSVGETEAVIMEAATGYDGAPFYGFITSDVESSLKDAINNELSTLSVNRHMLKTGKPAARTISHLRRGGLSYRYIVTGLTPDGRTYGTPVSVTFTTGGTFKESGVASISYNAETRKVEVSGFGNSLYDFGIVTKDTADSFGSDAELLHALIYSMKPDPVQGDITVGASLNRGKYVLLAFGVDEEPDIEGCYNPTLTYAKSEISIR